MGTHLLCRLYLWLVLGIVGGFLCPFSGQVPAAHGAPLSVKDLQTGLRLPAAASSGLNGGKVRQYPARSAGLGASSSSLGMSPLGGVGPSTPVRSSLGAASDSPMKSAGKLSSGGLGSSLTSGSSSGRRSLGSSTLGGGSSKVVLGSGAPAPPSRSSRHAHRHGHGGTRGQRLQGASGGPRVVRMECQSMRRDQLTSILGPAFNARYMSVEKPPEFRPPTAGFGLSPLPTAARRRQTTRIKWTSGGTLMGDQAADGEEEDDLRQEGSLDGQQRPSLETSRLYVDHPLSDADLVEPPSNPTADLDNVGLLSLGEIRGTPVATSRLPPPATRSVTHQTAKTSTGDKKAKALEAGLLGDQAPKEAVILVGLDALTGLPDFAVGASYRRDLPQEARAAAVGEDMERTLEEASVSGLLVYLRTRFNSTKSSLHNKATAAKDTLGPSGGGEKRRKRRHSVESETVDLLLATNDDKNAASTSLPVAADNAPESDDIKSRPRRASLGGGKGSLSGPGATEPWQCSSEVVWEDLGEDHFPRYIRRTRCVQRGCYNSFYECREKSFTIKVLRRVSDRCVPVYGVTVSTEGTSGVPTVRKSGVLRYEQEWVFEERALPFCCECAPRFL